MHKEGIYTCLMLFFNDTATTEIYTLSLHDALPISGPRFSAPSKWSTAASTPSLRHDATSSAVRTTFIRSEEHTSELQSRQYLVCRLLLEKKKRTVSAPSSSRRPWSRSRPASGHACT